MATFVNAEKNQTNVEACGVGKPNVGGKGPSGGGTPEGGPA